MKKDAEETKMALKIVGFISDVLQANSPEAMAKAIEAHALPPASFRIKKRYNTSFSLGAYFGPYGGVEYVKGRHNELPAVFGLSAPISLDFNVAANRDAYFTFSLVLLDIGAAVSYRISHDNQGLPENVRWSQLFSPGFAFRSGLWKTPLTFSIGAQLNPQLRDFGQQAKRDAIRAYAGLMIDMPLLFAGKGKEHTIKQKKSSEVVK